MKNKLYIVAFLVLFFASGGIVYFVKKQLDNKKNKGNESPNEEIKETVIEEPTGAKPRELENPRDLNIESDIEIDFDSVNRSFGYSWHYNGIGGSGVFKDGDEDVLVEKSFGSFVIKQRDPQTTILAPVNVTTKGGATQKGGTNVTSKGGANLGKVGTTVFDLTTSKPVAQIINSDFVDLHILDAYGLLHELIVNLDTGAVIGSKKPRNWDGD